MNLAFAILSLGLAALAGWLLRRALLRARDHAIPTTIVSPGGGSFGVRTTIALNAAALLFFAAAAAVLVYRAALPPLVPGRPETYYPNRARARNAEGLVVLHCTVTSTFGLKACTVRSETPPGLDFGASALQISAFTVLPEKDRSRTRPGEEINLPIRFKLPEGGG